LSADDLLAAIEEVFYRRGPIAVLYSDNGTNYRKAERLIRENCISVVANKRIQWLFAPAYTPAFNGAAERLIKEVKRALLAVMSNVTINDKTFRCALIQIEDIINQRPLTNLPATPDDFAPLTPNYLLKLHPGYEFMSSQNPSQEMAENYIQKALLISKKLMSRWYKEYLPTITLNTKPKLKDAGLRIGNLVIYCDCNLPPRKWPIGIITDTYEGRDGVVRVCDLKLKSGVVLKSRSAYQLAKIDYENKNINDDQVVMFSCVKSAFQKLTSNKSKMEDVKIGLLTQLAEIKFVRKHDLENPKATRAAILNIRELLADEVKDEANIRTVKIESVPNTTCLFEILYKFFALGWKCQQLNVESMAKDFSNAYVVFTKAEYATEAVNQTRIILAEAVCTLKRPLTSVQPPWNRNQQFAAIYVRTEESMDNWIAIVTRHNTTNKRHAISRFTGVYYDLYLSFCRTMQIEPVEDESPAQNSTTQNPIRSVIIIPERSQLSRHIRS
jgi:hypothetical protein